MWSEKASESIDSTLLSRISRQVCLNGTIFYAIFMFPSFLQSVERMNSPIAEEDMISPTSRVIIGSLSGFYLAAVAWNLSRLLTFKHLKRASTNGVTRLNLFIGTIASTSSLYTTVFGWGGMKEDYFGVRIPWSIWVEWMTCAPILVLMITAFDTKPSLSKKDLRAVLHAEIMIVTGLFIHINLTNLPAILPTLFLIISCICCKTPFDLVIESYNELKSTKKNILCRHGNKQLLAQHLSLTSRRYDLSRILAFIFPIFAVTYFIRALKYVTNEQCAIMFMVFGILTKVIYMEVASNAYLDEFHPSNIELLLLLKSDLERITYLKFVFHEARVPLQTISLGLEILNRSHENTTGNLVSNEELSDTIQHINQSTRSITEIFDHILLLHKINDKKMILKFRRVNLFNLLNRLYSEYLTEIQNKGITFTIHIDSNVPHEIVCDLNYLYQVVSIYLSNAIQFTPDNHSHSGTGAGAIQIYVFRPVESNLSSSDESLSSLCVEIHDTGIKIDPNEMSSIFQPYLEVNHDHGDTQSHRGTGIGLSLCREIIQLHGGDVYCKSSTNGCVFGFVIPLNLQEQLPSVEEINQTIAVNNSAPSMQSTSSVPTIVFPLENIYVLIADDSQINRKMLQRILFNKNIRSDTAENGLQAVEVYEQNPNKYCLIFMDNLMPEMNGLIASRRLREVGYRNLIVGLTGNVADDDKKAFILAGADLILSKPLKIEELDALITFITHTGPASLFNERKMISTERHEKTYEWIKSD